MTTYELPVQDQARFGFTHVAKITFSDVQAAAATTTVAIIPESGNNPIGTYVRFAGYHLVTAFDGGASSDLTVQIGDGGDTDRFLVAKSIHADATEVVEWVTANTTATTPYAYEAADTIDALFTCTGGNCSVLTSGEVWLFLAVADLSKLG